jgi:hypothetical protein
VNGMHDPPLHMANGLSGIFAYQHRFSRSVAFPIWTRRSEERSGYFCAQSSQLRCPLGEARQISVWRVRLVRKGKLWKPQLPR